MYALTIGGTIQATLDQEEAFENKLNISRKNHFPSSCQILFQQWHILERVGVALSSSETNL